MSTSTDQSVSRGELRLRAASGLDIPLDRLPRHIAIIMDGNGRWAQQRGLHRAAGHRAGAESVRAIITESRKIGLQALTLYSFSTENWQRPDDEVGALMELAVEHLVGEREELRKNNIRLRHIGRRDPLPQSVLDELDATAEATRDCDGLQLVLALNYGSRTEMVDAVRTIAEKIEGGTLMPAQIDEALISEHLYTSGLPDPDLLVRTAGEHRLSNYLLWQLSYAEFYISDRLWPDFREPDLHTAIRTYAHRERRFGATSEQVR